MNTLFSTGRDVVENDSSTTSTTEDITREFIQKHMLLLKPTKQNGTKLKKNTAFGTICFQGFGQKSSADAPYVKVNVFPKKHPDYSDIVTSTWRLMREVWKMPEPKLIISVTGGAKHFDLNNSLRKSFKRGLIRAATSAEAWIVTGGTHTGVMEIVGEAVNEYRLQTASTMQDIVLLGIVTWGIVDGRANLEDKNGKGCFPGNYNFQQTLKDSSSDGALLDHNHTHFIFVEDLDNNAEQYGQEIGFRAALEHHNTNGFDPLNPLNSTKASEYRIPVVLLILEGGKNTVKTAREAIEKNTPIVVIGGSGRAADFIAAASKLKTSERNGKSRDSKEQLNQLWKVWQSPKPSESEKLNLMNDINEILAENRHHLLTVIKQDDEDSGQGIDKAIINALIKANNSDVKSQLNLALAWNRSDVAQQEIFGKHEKWKDLDLNEAMFSALIQDKAKFVDLFLDSGVDIKQFLTVRRLHDLYKIILKDKSTSPSVELLKNLLTQVRRNSWGWYCSQDFKTDSPCPPNLLKHIGSVIRNLSGDQRENLYTDKKYIVFNETKSKRKKSKKDKRSRAVLTDEAVLKAKGGQDDNSTGGADDVPVLSSDPVDSDSESNDSRVDFEYPARDLLLWSLLLNRKKLAKIFWKLGQDHISSALTGSMLMKSLSDEATREEELDLAQELGNNAQKFEMLAVGVLNECYQKDKDMSHELLIRDLEQWGNKTLFVLADSAEQMDFMEHTCCQTKLNRIWKGKMALFTPMWKILLGLLLPFIALPLIKFTSSGAKGSSGQTNEVIPVQEGEGEDVTKRKRLGKVSFFKAILYYHTAPVVKFCYHTISYLIFLGLFSYFLLTELYPYRPKVVECIVWGWVVTMWIEEIRQIYTMEPKSIYMKLAMYFSSSWNQFDQVVDILFIISVILRLALSEEMFIWARMLYCITISLYFIRFLQVFYVEKNIGPKVVMIRQMVIDMLFFLLILSIFLLSYGIVQQALLYPNAPKTWNVLYGVLYDPYLSIYGEFNIDELQGVVGGCSSNATEYNSDLGIPRCPEKSWLVMILFAIYLILTNILLINLLIAMFSYTFNNVQDNSEKVWRFYRHDLIKEYFVKPTLAPPLIILSHTWRIIKWLRNKKVVAKIHNDFRRQFSPEKNSEFVEFEKACMYNYFLTVKKDLKGQDALEYKLDNTSQRVRKMQLDVELVKESIISMARSTTEPNTLPPLEDKISPTSSAQVVKRDEDVGLQMQLNEMKLQLDKITSLLLTSQSSRHPAFSSISTNPPATVQNIEIRDWDHGNIDV